MLKVILKFLFAGAIIAWLLKSGRLDFSLINRAFSEGYYWLICLLLVMSQAFIGAWRWKRILQIKTDNLIPYLASVRLTWIGLFFNSFLPGAVSGDLIKLLYARDLDRNLSKTFLLTSVVMDRVLGLIGLLIVLGVASVVSLQEMMSLSPKMENLVYFNFLLFFAAATFIAFIFFPHKMQKPFLNFAKKIPLIGEKIHHTLEQVWLIGGNKKLIAEALLLSLVSQIFACLALWTISYPFIAEKMPLLMALTFIPLGFITVALPISPAGLGVGHVAFATLFGYFGVDGGASLFNLYFLVLVFSNSLGVLPYLMMSGKRHSFSEASEEFEEMTS